MGRKKDNRVLAPKYVANCSFGKDSTATALLAMEKNEPLDEIMYVEIMYDHARNISAEIPVHRDFIYDVAIPYFESHGVKVNVRRTQMDYVTYFNHVKKRGNYIGEKNGFLTPMRCGMNAGGKRDAINKYNTELKRMGFKPVNYVGIAIDEPERLKGLDGENTISLLAKYGYTEAMAEELCRKYGLFSPIYSCGLQRNGCWFCPNAKEDELRLTWEAHPEYLEELASMESCPNIHIDKFNILKKTQMSDFVRKFKETSIPIMPATEGIDYEGWEKTTEKLLEFIGKHSDYLYKYFRIQSFDVNRIARIERTMLENNKGIENQSTI